MSGAIAPEAAGECQHPRAADHDQWGISPTANSHRRSGTGTGLRGHALRGRLAAASDLPPYANLCYTLLKTATGTRFPSGGWLL
jgi:hypothetical protein